MPAVELSKWRSSANRAERQKLADKINDLEHRLAGHKVVSSNRSNGRYA